MDGVAVVWRTRLTSLVASSDQRSTFRTYIVCSISLENAAVLRVGALCLQLEGCDLLAIHLLPRVEVGDDQTNTWGRGDGPPILVRALALVVRLPDNSYDGDARRWEWKTYLVAKATHARTLRLLHDVQTIAVLGLAIAHESSNKRTQARGMEAMIRRGCFFGGEGSGLHTHISACRR